MPWTQNALLAPDDGFPYEDFPDGPDLEAPAPHYGPKECPGCGRVMSQREEREQGICNDCQGGR